MRSCGSECADGKRGGVCGEDRLRAAGGGQRGEYLTLQVQILGPGLDHQLAFADRIDARAQCQTGVGGRRLGHAPAFAADPLESASLSRDLPASRAVGIGS